MEPRPGVVGAWGMVGIHPKWLTLPGRIARWREADRLRAERREERAAWAYRCRHNGDRLRQVNREREGIVERLVYWADNPTHRSMAAEAYRKAHAFAARRSSDHIRPCPLHSDYGGAAPMSAIFVARVRENGYPVEWSPPFPRHRGQQLFGVFQIRGEPADAIVPGEPYRLEWFEPCPTCGPAPVYPPARG